MDAQAGKQITTGGMLVAIPGVGGGTFRARYHWYDVQLTRTAVAGASVSGVIQTQPGPPFLCESVHIGDTVDGNPLTSQEEFFVSAQDSDTGYNWTDTQVPRSAFAGSREFGLQLTAPLVIKGNTRITFNVVNNAAPTGAGTTTISLRGWLLFPA